MENVKLDLNSTIKVSNLKLTLLILSIPISLLPVGFLVKLAPGVYNWLPINTKGILTPTLIIYVILYFLFVYLLLIKGHKFTLINLGLNRSKVKKALILTLILFTILQVYSALESYFTLGSLVLNEVMKKGLTVVGYYLELLFGVALFEEIIFRGFLIPQVFIRLNSEKSKTLRMFLALAISQFLFAAVHIPIRLVSGMGFAATMVNLLPLFALGLTFAFIYILTENLFMAIGIHAIWNAAMNNAVTIYSSKYAFIVVGLFAFTIMYVQVLKNKSKNISITRNT